MLNKISNLKLIIGLVLLALVYLAVTYLDSPKSEELDKQLVAIDTAKVTQINIIGKDQTVNLYKENQGWQVALSTGKQVKAESSRVTSLLNQLLNIGTDRLAAKDKSKWSDYQVDSTGTRLQVKEGDATTLDMIIGQSGTTSYLRLADEIEVYASDGFQGLGSKQEINHYRDNLFVEMDTDSLTSISFNYPDSSFQIINNAGSWQFEDGMAADSAKTAAYLGKLSLKSSENFAAQDGSTVGPTLAEIKINSNSQPQVTIRAYSDNADSVVYQTSINQEAYFADKTLGEDFFIGRSALSN